MADADPTPFAQIGGAPAIKLLVDRFYDEMDANPAYAGLRAMHADDLTPMRASLTGFLTGWAGGPRDWFQGGKCIMSAHRGLAIDAALAEQWMAAMRQAARDLDTTDALRQSLLEALGRMAKAMVRH